MKAVAVKQFGGVENLVDIELPLPEPKAGEVRIRVKASAFNPFDYKKRQGHFGGDLPMVLGADAAGVVDAVGSGTPFKVGDEVWCFLCLPANGFGAYSQYIVTNYEFVCRKPKNLSFEEAASLPVAALTAYACVYTRAHADQHKGEWAFVSGGSGGVGSFVVQMLRHLGVNVISSAGSPSSAEYLQKLGVQKQHVLNYRELSHKQMVDQIHQITDGRGVMFAFDLVGGFNSKHLCINAIETGGRVITIVEEPDPKFAMNVFDAKPGELFLKGGSVELEFLMAKAISGKRYWGWYHPAMEAVSALLEHGHIKPAQIEVLGPLSGKTAQEAHRRLESHHTTGKLVMTVE